MAQFKEKCNDHFIEIERQVLPCCYQQLQSKKTQKSDRQTTILCCWVLDGCWWLKFCLFTLFYTCSLYPETLSKFWLKSNEFRRNFALYFSILLFSWTVNVSLCLLVLLLTRWHQAHCLRSKICERKKSTYFLPCINWWLFLLNRVNIDVFLQKLARFHRAYFWQRVSIYEMQ